MSRLKITRPSGLGDKLRAYRVLVDGQVVGEIREHATLELEVAPGVHAVQLKIDWCTSPRVEIEVAPQGMAALTCGPRFSPLLALLAISVFRRRYLRLDVVIAGQLQAA